MCAQVGGTSNPPHAPTPAVTHPLCAASWAHRTAPVHGPAHAQRGHPAQRKAGSVNSGLRRPARGRALDVLTEHQCMGACAWTVNGSSGTVHPSSLRCACAWTSEPITVGGHFTPVLAPPRSTIVHAHGHAPRWGTPPPPPRFSSAACEPKRIDLRSAGLRPTVHPSTPIV
jgi:hypothetical protein